MVSNLIYTITVNDIENISIIIQITLKKKKDQIINNNE